MNPDRLQNESRFNGASVRNSILAYSNPSLSLNRHLREPAADTYTRVKDALSYIPAGCDREQWVKIAQAIKSEFGDQGFSLFDFWSSTGANYVERDCRDTYKSIKAEGGVNLGSLFYIAHKYGYRPNSSGFQRIPMHHSKKSVQNEFWRGDAASHFGLPEEDCRSVTQQCVELLNELPLATEKNGYLSRKGLPAISAMREGRDGYLVVPVQDINNQIISLQFIAPNGHKRFIRGSSVKGGFLLIQGAPSSELLICEGVATAITLSLATHLPVTAAFMKSNLLEVARIMREKCPNTNIMICADNDRFSITNGGVRNAEAAARAVNGYIAIPHFATDEGTDFDDLRMSHGLGAVKEQIYAAWKAPLPRTEAEIVEAPFTGRYRTISAANLCSTPPMRWMVAGVLPMTGLAAIYGSSGSGKSFLALDLAAAIAAGDAAWFSRRIIQVPVTIVALEGEHGLGKRIRAWTLHHQKPVPDSLRFIAQSFSIRSNEDLKALATAIRDAGGEHGLTIIDTLNRAAEGAEENSSAHMSEIIGGAKRLQEMTGGLVLLVHHTGKDQSAGMRGHSSLHAALDGAIEVQRQKDVRNWRIAKAKDDADGDIFGFYLETVVVGTDEYGENITSCVVVPNSATSAAVKKMKRPTGKLQRIAIEALDNFLKSIRENSDSDLSKGTAIEYERAVDVVAPYLPVPGNKRRNKAREVIDSIIDSGWWNLLDGLLYCRQ